MTLEQRLSLLATAIGADVKALKLADGDLTALSTTAKTNLVAALNEVYALANSGSSVILDTANNTITNKTWSANKIDSAMTAAIAALRTELRAGAGAALDTFAEVAAQLAADEGTAAALATAVGNRVRFDAAQALTGAQQIQARSNIAAQDAAAIGNPDADLAAAYVTAKT